jgi:WD40 repeat protein
VFVSYGRADASDYALALGVGLTKEGISCYLDQWGSHPGHQVPPDVMRMVRRCTLLVVIGSKAAGASERVGEEIREFVKTGRPIIPVLFEDEPADIVWLDSIHGVARTFEPAEALARGAPSAKVIERIANAEGFSRRNVRLRRIAAATGMAIIALVIVGGLLVNRSKNELESSQDALAKTQVAVKQQRQRLRDQELLTELKRREAERYGHAAAAQLLVSQSIAVRDGDPELGIALAMHAVRATRRFHEPVLPGAENALHAAIRTSAVRRTFRPGGGRGAITGVAFNVDGDLLATVGEKDPLRLWDVETGRNVKTFSTPRGLRQVRFSPDGLRLATAGANVIVRDAATGKIQHELPGQLVAFNGGGEQIATAELNDDPEEHPMLRVFEADTGRELFSQEAEGQIVAMAMSPDGAHIVTSGVDVPALAVWDMPSDPNPAVLKPKMLVDAEGLFPATVAYSPEGRELVAAGMGGMRIWLARAGKMERGLDQGPFPAPPLKTPGRSIVAFSPDGELLATSDDSGDIQITGLGSNGSFSRVLRGHHAPVMSLVFNPNDSRQLASADASGAVKLWDLDASTELPALSDSDPVAFSTDSKRLLMRNGQAHDVNDEQRPSKLFKDATVLAVSEDWKLAVIHTESSGSELWSVEPRKRLLLLSRESLRVAFSRDGSRLAAAGNEVVLWDTASRRKLRSRRAGDDRLVAISANGRYFATGTRQGQVRLFDANGAVLLRTRGHDSWSKRSSSVRTERLSPVPVMTERCGGGTSPCFARSRRSPHTAEQ